MTPAITVSGLSKRYTVYHAARPNYESLRDAVADGVSALARGLVMRRAERPSSPTSEEFWALKDINFQLMAGERLGVIGRNGAGKSTLLKLLSRITDPTEGRIEIRGRVSSLLEVGTGFHPELTGRENIFLNGSILGMRKTEIARKFDEIVAFAEVERFLDMPVKRYSSGMYVRLAFSVAAHLQPDILIVDEVLAVGDAQFQRKCLGRMEAAGKEGRTVIFVSHNLSMIENLCPRALLIERGRLAASGASADVIATYVDLLANAAATPLSERTDRSGKGNIRLVNVEFLGSRGGGQYAIGDDISIRFDLRSDYAHETACRLSAGVYGAQDNALISCDSVLLGRTYRIAPRSITSVTCRITAPPLNLGEYHLAFAVFDSKDEPEDWISSLSKFSISFGVFDSRSASNRFPVLAKFDWLTSDGR